jgi:zinc D-Ala-D-Ala carboxypeptidase
MKDIQLSTNLQLSELTRSESAKRRRISNQPTEAHIENMKYLAEKVFQPIRDHFGVPIRISSGYRSAALNKAIGGSQSSFHSLGCAIDIDNDGTSITNKEIFDFIKDNLEYTELIWEFGTKSNPDWVHVAIVKGREKEKETLEAYRVKGKTLYRKYNG